MLGRPEARDRLCLLNDGFLAGVALCLALSAPAHSQDLTHSQDLVATAAAGQRITEYLGGGYLTLNETCAEFGWSGTHQIMVRAQPQGMPGNPENESQMAIFFATGVISFRYDQTEETLSGGAPAHEATYVWNGPWSPATPTMTISTRSRYGDQLTSGAADVRSLYLTLGNFNEHEGCTATMRVSLGRN
ncbi:MAG: hypothetical protein Kow0013_13840 [Pararhodobacter sp.]